MSRWFAVHWPGAPRRTNPAIGLALTLDPYRNLMQYTMYLVIVAVTFASFLTSVHIAPPAFKLLPEGLSAIVAAYVIAAGALRGFRYIGVKYWLVFLALASVLICGAIANFVAPGPLLAGMRFYVRCVPFFFVPAICNFDERQLWKFLRLILVISVLQMPIAVYQRLSLLAVGRNTGDPVYGSLMLSGTLTMFLICVLCVLTALYVRKRVGGIAYLALFLCLVIPMSINETKVTAFILPPSLFATFVFASDKGKRLRYSAIAVSMLISAAAIFVPLYDYLNAKNAYDEHPFRIEDYFEQKQVTKKYLDSPASIGDPGEPGRVACVVIPLEELSRDPVKLAFGLGVGNVSKSILGEAFSGRYSRIYGRYQTSLGTFLFEIGVLGVSMLILLHLMVFADTLAVARHDRGLVGIMAVGWLPTVAIASLGLFYINLHLFESFSYLFWFFSGWIAAQRVRLRQAAPRAP
jgi:hypothetical protein